jgi:hypothetical protein
MTGGEIQSPLAPFSASEPVCHRPHLDTLVTAACAGRWHLRPLRSLGERDWADIHDRINAADERAKRLRGSPRPPRGQA